MRRMVPVLLLLALVSCASPIGGKTKLGCLDRAALNFDPTVDKDNGTCTFSKTVFYTGPLPPGALPVRVLVDGAEIGTINGVYPLSPPGNCSADFTVPYPLKDSRSHDWTARTNPTPTGGFNSQAGTFSADHSKDCVLIKVF